MNTTDRDMKISNLLIEVDKEVESIMETFKDFTDGMRLMILMERKKDGGHNEEEKRVFETAVTYTTEGFKYKLRNLLILKRTSSHELRLYLSANPRSVNKVIRNMEQRLLDAHYIDQEQKDNLYRKICGAQRTFIMQPCVAKSKLFILDIDNEPDTDTMGIAIQKIDENGLQEILRYKTKNGWHIVTKPFNPAIWGNPDQIKKDGLLLLSY